MSKINSNKIAKSNKYFKAIQNITKKLFFRINLVLPLKIQKNSCFISTTLYKIWIETKY